MKRQKGKNNPILPRGKYKVIEIPNGRRTVAIVEKVGSSNRYRAFFSSFRLRYFVPGKTLWSDGVGEIEIMSDNENEKMP